MKNPVPALALAVSLAFASCSGDGAGPVGPVGPIAVPVEGVALAPAGMALSVGGSGSLTATIAPEDATDRAVSWESSAPGVASVSGSGLSATVTAVAPGDAAITVRTRDGGRTAACPVSVLPAGPPAVFVAGGFGLYLDGFKDAVIGDQILFDLHVDADGHVRAAGELRDAGGRYWAARYLDGAPTVMEIGHGGDAFQSVASSISVDPGGGTRVAGYEAFYSAPGEPAHAARLWGGDGRRIPLAGVDETGSAWSAANVVKARGGDVWVGGMEWDRAPYPCIWKNDVMTLKETHDGEPIWSMEVSDMAFGSDGRMYVVVHNYYYGDDFDNGVFMVNPDDPADWSLLYGYDGDNYPLRIFADGDTLYAAGFTALENACYWRDGAKHVLKAPAGAHYAAEANDVFVHDGHTYIIGHSVYPGGHRATLWLDGEVVTDGRAIPDVITQKPSAVRVQHIEKVPALSVSLDKQSLDVRAGDRGAIAATVLPPDATHRGVAWASSDPSVATVAGTGLAAVVTGARPGGPVAITAKSPDGPEAVCMVTVLREPVTDIRLPPAKEMALGRAGALTATVLPANATDKAVAWASSDADVVTVGPGQGLTATVTAMGLGVARITARSLDNLDDGGLAAHCDVTVVPRHLTDDPRAYAAGRSGLYIDGQRDQTSYGDNMLWDVMLDGDDGVHVVGWDYDAGLDPAYGAGYWKDGAKTRLPMSHAGGDSEAAAYGLWVGGHVYVAGVEFGKDGTRNARLWLDGQIFPLQGVIEESEHFSFAYAVRERDGSHYVAGGAEDEAYGPHPVIWRDGAKHVMPGAFDYFKDMGMAPGGAMHALGSDGNVYSIAADLSSMSQAAVDPGAPQRIFVDGGGDVYLAGYLGQDACYWKNGERHMAERPAGAAWAEAGDVCVHDGHVYLVGRASYNNVGIRFEAWVDGAHAPDRSSSYASVLLDAPTGLSVKKVPGAPATGVVISGADPLEFPVGRAEELTATVLPADAGNKAVLWKSDNPAVATVAPAGDGPVGSAGSTAVVTGRADGHATITATSVDGPWAARAVSVRTVAAEGVSVSPASMSLGRLRSAGVEAVVLPADATNKNVAWATSDASVATVAGAGASATVSGVALGGAAITARTEDGGYTASCQVTVVEPIDPAIYITGRFGLFIDGAKDSAIGDNQVWETRVDASGAAYTAGSLLDQDAGPEAVACLYRNGVPGILPAVQPGGESCAYGLWLAGGHAYAAGVENGAGGAPNARLWIDQQPSPLRGTIEDGGHSSHAWAVRELNGDVYVAGGAQDESLAQRPVIWKNGDMHAMPGGFAYLRDMDFAADGTLRAFGDGAVFTVAADLSTMTETFRATGGLAGRMHVFGDDVYVVGRLYSNDACYWLNGEPHSLGRPPDVSYSEATGICVFEGSVFVSGRSYTGSPYMYSRLELWIDGEYIEDSRRPVYETTANGLTWTSHIFVWM
jgi:uncharacterized protein YjdB